MDSIFMETKIFQLTFYLFNGKNTMNPEHKWTIHLNFS